MVVPATTTEEKSRFLVVDVPEGERVDGAVGAVLSIVTVVAERERSFEPRRPVATPVTEPTAVSSISIGDWKVKFAYPKSKLVAVELVMLITFTEEELEVSEAENRIVR